MLVFVSMHMKMCTSSVGYCGKMSGSMHEYWVECVHGQHSVKLAGEIVRDIIKLLLIPAR